MIEAALALADAEGLEGLTVRRVTSQLGVTPMALYSHVADKHALLDALADHVWADASALAGAPVADPWQDLRAIVDALVTAMCRHPVVAPLLPERFAAGEASLDLGERALGVLTRLGFDAHHAADLAKWLLSSAMALVVSQPGIAIPDRRERDRVARTKRGALLALPPDRYPLTIAAADAFTDCEDPAGYIALGVELLIGGVRATAPAAVGMTVVDDDRTREQDERRVDPVGDGGDPGDGGR